MSLKSGIYKHRRTVRRVVAGVVVLCCLWAVYIRYVSPTRVALVNFPAYQASSIALANESRWVRVDVLTVEEAAKIGRYDVALFFGPGLRLNGDQAGFRSGEVSNVAESGFCPVVIDCDVFHQCGGGFSGADGGKVIFHSFFGFAHVFEGFVYEQQDFVRHLISPMI